MTNDCKRTGSWDVYVPTSNAKLKHIDTVFFNKDCDLDYVRTSLINHDGYPYNIIVRVHNPLTCV